jgi:hypothetical protein
MPDNFFQLYDELTSETEPAKSYHLWSALSVINNVLGKKTWFPMGHFDIYPNLYLLYVGPAGNRKTTALSISDKLFSQTKISQVADTASTSEAIIDTMASEKARVHFTCKGKQQFYQQYSPYCSEFATFLGGKHINEGLIRFLTDIFDPREVYKYKTKNRGEAKIDNPFFSFTGACTMDWFLDNIKEGLLTSGFARRIIFVYASSIYKENPLPEASPRMPEILHSLLGESQRISKLVGPFSLDSEAKELHTSSYHLAMQKARETDDFMSSYYGTKSVLVLKVCMGMSAGLGNSLVITRPIYQLALDAFDEVEFNYPSLFQGTGRNELKKYQSKILSILGKEVEGVLADKLCLRFFNDMGQSEFKECVQVLLAGGQVRSLPEGNDTRLFAQQTTSKAQDRYLLASLAKLTSPEQVITLDTPYPVEQVPEVKKKTSSFKIKLSEATLPDDSDYPLGIDPDDNPNN